MKILAIGDFHGKFPKKFEKIVKKEKIDLVVSVGDYPPFYYRKIWFKHCFGKETGLWEVIGKKKYKKLVFDDYRMGEAVLKKLNKLPVSVITVLGNVDWPLSDDVSDHKKPHGKKYYDLEWNQHKVFGKILKKYKNIKRFDYSYFKFGDYVFIGMRGHSFPGRVKSKGYKKHRAILDKFFRKFNKENKERKLIFVSHIVPFNTKLDKLSKKAHKLVRGLHRGSKLAKRIINHYQPIVAIAGHVHEGFGRDKIKKTIVLNTGSAAEGKGFVIDFVEGKKPKIKAIK